MNWITVVCGIAGALFLFQAYGGFDYLTKLLKSTQQKVVVDPVKGVEKIESNGKVLLTELVYDWDKFRTKCANNGLVEVTAKLDEIFPMFLKVYNEK